MNAFAFSTKMTETINMVKNFIVNVAGIYIGWTVIHMIASNLYPVYCAEMTLWGLIKSVFVAPAPHCRALRWVINTGGSTIEQMWIVLGTWLCGNITVMLMKRE